MEPHRFLLKIWYDGTHFAGSQQQPYKRTVEGELIFALIENGYILDRKTGNFKTAARTDAGVHALEAAFCFTSEKPFYPTLLDSRLPKDMGIIAWVEVPLTFHPRWEATKKEYYYVYPRSFLRSSLNINKMEQALTILRGTHDFRMFSKTDHTKRDKLTVLTLEQAHMESHPQFYQFVFKSKSYLWEQIRRMMAFLIKIGQDIYTLEDLQALLNPINHSNPKFHREKPVSATGLILSRMEFSIPLQFQQDAKFMKHRTSYFTHKLFDNAQASGIFKTFLDSE